jgi:hypothetical protein
MTAWQKIIAGALIGLLWLAAIVSKHFWTDIDTGAFQLACGAALSALGIHSAATGGSAQGGFASVRMMVTLAMAAFGLTMLGGCSTAARMWEVGAYDQIKGANDNALAIWKAAGCAMPVGAILRDPDAIESVNRFCGGPKTQLGATNAAPAAAPASAVK